MSRPGPAHPVHADPRSEYQQIKSPQGEPAGFGSSIFSLLGEEGRPGEAVGLMSLDMRVTIPTGTLIKCNFAQAPATSVGNPIAKAVSAEGVAERSHWTPWTALDLDPAGSWA